MINQLTAEWFRLHFTGCFVEYIASLLFSGDQSSLTFIRKTLQREEVSFVLFMQIC